MLDPYRNYEADRITRRRARAIEMNQCINWDPTNDTGYIAIHNRPARRLLAQMMNDQDILVSMIHSIAYGKTIRVTDYDLPAPAVRRILFRLEEELSVIR